jgi:hypothetical protein
MKANPDELLREVTQMAERLAERKCVYMAGVLLYYYDGEFAEETKTARQLAAKKYFDLARAQTNSSTPFTGK